MYSCLRLQDTGHEQPGDQSHWHFLRAARERTQHQKDADELHG